MSKLKVCAKQCSQCLFSRNRIVSDKRAADIIQQCVRTDQHFICHKSDDVVCRGFYDKFDTNFIRLMSCFGGIEFVDPENQISKESK